MSKLSVVWNQNSFSPLVIHVLTMTYPNAYQDARVIECAPLDQDGRSHGSQSFGLEVARVTWERMPDELGLVKIRRHIYAALLAPVTTY